MMDIFGGIDGTGPFGNDSYKAEFKNSFVAQLANRFAIAGGRAVRLRGPSLLGFETGSLAEILFARIAQNVASVQAPRVFIAGYSRGGLAVIETCERLRRQGIGVHCLMLFDAVDMTVGLEGKTVPGNVAMCFHAKRDPRGRSRHTWGNCGGPGANRSQYEEKPFYCTHGAMGGLPWITADRDGMINESGLPDDGDQVNRIRFGNNPDLPPVGEDLYHKAGRTRITIAQDAKGSAEVRKWMFAALDRQLRTASTSKPGLVV